MGIGDDMADDGKHRLLKGAMQCVADHGMAGSSVRKIAEYAGVTPGLIRHHFGGKNALLAECYRNLNVKTLARIEQQTSAKGGTLDDDILNAIKAFFPQDMRDVSQMRVLVAFWGAVLTIEDFADVQRETRQAFGECLVRIMQAHRGPHPEHDLLADALIAVTDGLWLECCMNPENLSPDDAVERAHKIASLAFRSLC